MPGLGAKDGPPLHHRVYALSIHADYSAIDRVCAVHRDWDVPVELPLYRSLTTHWRPGVCSRSRRLPRPAPCSSRAQICRMKLRDGRTNAPG